MTKKDLLVLIREIENLVDNPHYAEFDYEIDRLAHYSNMVDDIHNKIQNFRAKHNIDFDGNKLVKSVNKFAKSLKKKK